MSQAKRALPYFMTGVIIHRNCYWKVEKLRIPGYLSDSGQGGGET